MPTDPERRDRHQRERTRRAADLASRRGELAPELYRALMALLSFTDDRCAPCWPSLQTIAHAVDPDRCHRTAGRWMRQLRELGWVERIHRYRIEDGRVIGTSNLWRPRIPDDLRDEQYAIEDAARARNRSNRRRPGSGRYTPPASSDSSAEHPPDYGSAQARQERPCTECHGARWLDPAGTGDVVVCPTCDATGLAPP